MEFLIISETKLKIMLDRSEMQKYGLDKGDIDYSDSSVRAAFWEILDIAAKKCGFSARGDKVLIQFYPSKSGGEIFITKLGLLSKAAEKTISSSGRVAMLKSETRIYKFHNCETASVALRQRRAAISDNTAVYKKEDGTVYILIEERGEMELSIFSEYGDEIPSSLESYIIERCEKIPIST